MMRLVMVWGLVVAACGGADPAQGDYGTWAEARNRSIQRPQ